VRVGFRQYAGLDQWWGPGRCAATGGGKIHPDAHGRWRYGNDTVPFWVYSDTVRQPTRALMATVERHLSTHPATADRPRRVQRAPAPPRPRHAPT
jgi:hypothetical protein